MARRKKFTIIFKSGRTARFRATEVEVTRRNGVATNLKWDGADRFVSVVTLDEVEAIVAGWRSVR